MDFSRSTIFGNDGHANKKSSKEEVSTYDFVTDIARKLGYLKDYETSYSKPGEGNLIVNFRGRDFSVKVEPVD